MNYMDDFEEIVGTQDVSDNIYFICAKRSSMWTPRTAFGLVKNGKFRSINIHKDHYVTPAHITERADIRKAVEEGNCIHFTSDELFDIAREIGYLVAPTMKNLSRTVDWFIHGRGEDYEYGMEWGSKIKGILTDDEKALFREFEEMVGYDDVEIELPWRRGGRPEVEVIRKYHCEDFDLKSALYVVMNSPRLLNCAIYLKGVGISDRTLNMVWNYLIAYTRRDSFVEVVHLSDWDGDEHDTDRLHEKYSIPHESKETESRFFRNEATLYEGDKYKMALRIDSYIDDWGGTAVVVPKDCKLSPLEIISAGMSVDSVENNFYVKNMVVEG